MKRSSAKSSPFAVNFWWGIVHSWLWWKHLACLIISTTNEQFLTVSLTTIKYQYQITMGTPGQFSWNTILQVGAIVVNGSLLTFYPNINIDTMWAQGNLKAEIRKESSLLRWLCNWENEIWNFTWVYVKCYEEKDVTWYCCLDWFTFLCNL